MGKETQNEFGWENNTDTHTFFDTPEATVTINPEAVVKEVENDELVITNKNKVVTPPATSDKDEEEEEEHVFKFGGESEEKEDDDEEGEPADKGAVTKISSKSTLEFLKEKGLIDFELAEGEVLTDELAEEKLEDFLDDSIDAGVDEAIKDLPDALKDMIKFVNNGGDFGTLLAKMANNVASVINKNTDMTKEENQVLAVSTDLREQGYDDEYIDTQIQFLKDSGKLETISTKAFDKITTKQEAETADAIEKSTKAKDENKKKQRAFKAELTTHVSSLKEIGGIAITPKDQKDLPAYISDVNVTLADGRVTTGLQQKLFSIFGDKEKLLLLAKIVQSDFDFSSVKTKGVTEFSKGIKNDIQNNTISVKGGSKGSSQKQKRSLADMLD